MGAGRHSGCGFERWVGPDPDGSYLVRQLAVLGTGPNAPMGVALAAKPADGTFASGIVALNQLAEWVAANQAQCPSFPC